MSKAFVELLFERKESHDLGVFSIEYSKNEDASYGYYAQHHWSSKRCPIITIYWSKDRVVLHDCGNKDDIKVLNALLPGHFKIRRYKGQLVVVGSVGEAYLWTGSQVLSLSKHYNIYDSPHGVAKFEGQRVHFTPTTPIQAVTVVRTYGTYNVNTYELHKSWYQGGWGRRSEYRTHWSHVEVIAHTLPKQEAISIAQRYSAEHRVPYVERLFERRFGSGVSVRFIE